MSLALNIQQQTVSPVDALWTLFQGQSKKVREEFVLRIMALVNKDQQSDTLADHKNMTYADISSRLESAENDILSGNVMACEDVHRNIEEKCPWL